MGLTHYCGVPPAPEYRFRNGYEIDQNGCWIWRGCSIGRYGYGSLKINRKPVYAHRYSWEIHNGPIPDGLCVCHKCDVAKCVNPDHLFLGTHADNMADRNIKGRAVGGLKNPMRGIDHPRAKLTEKQVLSIREDKRTLREIAAEYGVCHSVVNNIKRRKTWRHI